MRTFVSIFGLLNHINNLTNCCILYHVTIEDTEDSSVAVVQIFLFYEIYKYDC